MFVEMSFGSQYLSKEGLYENFVWYAEYYFEVPCRLSFAIAQKFCDTQYEQGVHFDLPGTKLRQNIHRIFQQS